MYMLNCFQNEFVTNFQCFEVLISKFVDFMVLGWMCAYYLVPGHHVYASRLPETTGSRTIEHRSIRNEWGQGSGISPETDVWKFKTRRLNMEHSRGNNQFRRLFQIFQTSVLGSISLEPIQTSVSIGNRRLFQCGQMFLAQKQTSVSYEPDVWFW